MRTTQLLASTMSSLLFVLLAACGMGDPPDVGDARTPGELGAGDLEARTELPAAEIVDDATASGRFQLGTHYLRLSPTQPTSSGAEQVEVAEIFWYGCPHCYTFESFLDDWQGDKAEYINFVRVPAVWNPLVELHARAFYTAEALGKGDEMHDAFFDEIHERGNPLDSTEALAEFFGRFDVDADAFRSAFESFDVHAKVQRANELARRYRVTSVPSVVVNGKYTTNATMAGGYDTLLVLIDELAASERPAN